jgi:energy-coupling factor transport system permease protein
MPVLEGALERSIDLAAAMDARGFGRAGAGKRARNVSGALTLAGLLGVCAGLYGLLDAGSPVLLGLPLLGAGGLLAAGGLSLGGRRAARSRYRPDLWGAQEWWVAGSGLVAAAAALAGAGLDPAAMFPSTSPLEVPSLAAVPALGLLAALLPARVAPAPERAGPAPADATVPAAEVLV